MTTDPDEATAVPSTRHRAWRWLVIAADGSGLLTLIIAIVVGAHSFAWSDLPAFIDRMTAWRGSPLAMATMLGCFVVGGLVVFPVNLLIATSIVVFGPIAGGVIAFIGSLARAEIGRGHVGI